MNLERAIERLNIMVINRENRGYHHELAALKLGIEALKRLQMGRSDPFTSWIKLLPSETKEYD